MSGWNVGIPAQAKAVIPAPSVIPAEAGIQGALDPRLRGNDELHRLRGDDAFAPPSRG